MEDVIDSIHSYLLGWDSFGETRIKEKCVGAKLALPSVLFIVTLWMKKPDELCANTV